MKCNFCSWYIARRGPDGKADKWACLKCHNECEKDDLVRGEGIREGSWVKRRERAA